MNNFWPDALDHNDALAAASAVPESQRKQLDSDLVNLSIVAGAYACNDQAWMSRGTYMRSLTRCRDAAIASRDAATIRATVKANNANWTPLTIDVELRRALPEDIIDSIQHTTAGTVYWLSNDDHQRILAAEHALPERILKYRQDRAMGSTCLPDCGVYYTESTTPKRERYSSASRVFPGRGVAILMKYR